MARITVEDCIKQVTNQYELVILAKERAVQLGRGAAPAVDPENDKKPVIALREIGESKITKDELHDSIVNKLRQVSDYQEEDENEVIEDDTFRQMYQGGLSKSEMEKTATRKFTSRTVLNSPRSSWVIISAIVHFEVLCCPKDINLSKIGVALSQMTFEMLPTFAECFARW